MGHRAAAHPFDPSEVPAVATSLGAGTLLDPGTGYHAHRRASSPRNGAGRCDATARLIHPEHLNDEPRVLGSRLQYAGTAELRPCSSQYFVHNEGL